MALSPRTRVTRIAASCLLLAACGQKGPPLAPMRLVPAAVTELSLRRIEDRVRLRLLLPAANANGPGPVELDRVEIFAVTVGPGAPPPPNRDLLTKEHLVGQIQVRPPAVEGEAPAEGETRPAPGEPVTFEEELTPQKLTPVPPAQTAATPPAEAAGKPPPEAAGKPPAEAGAKPSADPVRIYVARGVTRGGRAGPPSTRASLPVVPVPPPPTGITARSTEKAVVLEWTRPAEAPAAAYNIYLGDEPERPVNGSPLTTASFEHAAPFGQEHCYRVRSVAVAGDVAIEGEPSAPACITPRDVFPPAAPQGLVAVPTAGQISLIWDANAEGDLAGYLVLRGDAPDGPLQALTAAPIRETSYRDATVTPGNRYIYAVVAVDTATPPNTSAQSARIEETAR